MIARQALPQHEPPRRGHVRARDASRRRARRKQLAGYSMLGRIVAVTGIALLPVMLYVLLMGNLTAQNYALAHAMQQKIALQEESQRLDDRIASLESRDRLADLAARLHMHDPHVYAVVDMPLPVATPPPNGIAFLGALFHH